MIHNERPVLEIVHEEFTFREEAEDRPMWASWTNTLGMNILATGGEDGVVCVWDVASNERLHRMEVSKGNRVSVLHFSHDDTALVVATDKVQNNALPEFNVYSVEPIFVKKECTSHHDQ
jgi:WD40 repeat protein